MRSFEKEIENNFSFLTKFGFTIFFPAPDEMGGTIAIFNCLSFKMRLMLYHQELYLEFSKSATRSVINEYSDEEDGITFHWFIEYFSDNDRYKTNFFGNELNYDDRIKKQIISISGELSVYITRIIEFFNSKDYEEQYLKLKKYIYKRLKESGLL